MPALIPFHAVFAAAIIAAGLLATGAAGASPLRGVIGVPELAARLGAGNLVVLDIRSGETREKGAALYRAGHVPGAVHADYAHASWRLPREKISVYLPEPTQFEALAGELGIGNDSDVVVVHEGEDASSFGAAARVYWTFKAMGHASIAILDGGHRAWRLAGQPLSSDPVSPQPSLYEAKPVPALRASLQDVLAAGNQGVTLVDSRPESFYTGLEKHRAVKGFGHIPGAVSIPHTRALGPDNKLLDAASLARNFAAADGPTIAYCNTGHWAATDWFVLSEVLGRDNIRLYDGSMLEYTLENQAPVTGRRPGSGS
ncbi:sulfurtransferase [Rhabdaerophilum calidifontis]|uniref:sulfurtransferase n=1 Tax=Rhabdaerophilum calidifontis TaxID=2604328 RepID=UPI00123949E1|nr:sulfurtransferase [Rhabdaerophilum calidifontis]